MMNSKYHFQTENVLLQINTNDKNEAVGLLVENIFDHYPIDLDEPFQKKIINQFIEREKKGSTGLQYGIAIPHIKSEDTNKICLSIGISKEGIDFDALDQHPAQLIILSIVPIKYSNDHLKFLGSLSKALFQKENRENLLKAKVAADVYQFISDRIPNE